MDTITITESEAIRYRFPEKAIGYWGIVEDTEEYLILHRLNKNGRFGSDRPNNILKMQKQKVEDFFTEKKPNNEKLITAKASDGQEVVICRMHSEDNTEPKVEKPTEGNIKMNEPKESWKNPKIGTRKTRWIEQLLEMMKSEPFTGEFIEKYGETKFVEQVLKDTDPEREFGKAYSSIVSAMKVWNCRIMKGFDYGER